MEKDKIVFKGSHPDSLYRVSASGGVGAGKRLTRWLRILRWPAALVLVCLALALFVYFLMPDNIDSDRGNGTYWEAVTAGPGAHTRKNSLKLDRKPDGTETTPRSQGTKTSEIDFYDADTDKSFDITSVIDSATETSAKRKLPIQPVFPAHIAPEVQYGNEKADSDKLRSAKILEETNTLPEDSTLKPHITQKPEKPLEIYFRDGNGITTTLSASETAANAVSLNNRNNYGDKYNTKQTEEPKIHLAHAQTPVFKDRLLPQQAKTSPPVYEKEPDIPPEIQEFHQRRPANVDVNFTSGHSKLFGISIEDAEKMIATTPSSAYKTRVSPTLPTWRDGDDSTTKKYPVNVNYDVPQCRSTRLALCRDVLPYDLAGPALKLNGIEVTALLPQVEYLIATNCSERLQHFFCALLEPECNPPPFPAKLPCYNLCKAISDSCEDLVPREVLPALNCNQYSSSNCLAAKSPCHFREMACGDGTCVPRDWVCDGAKDCPGGEDEAKCVVCETNEFKCPSGGCILKRWMCDGYADCPGGEDEAESVCDSGDSSRSEPGEESAGSAPAPAVRSPFRSSAGRKHKEILGDNDSSQELLVTSDSNNAFKRNYTRRPSLSRLMPYTRSMYHDTRPKEESRPKDVAPSKEQSEEVNTEVNKPKVGRNNKQRITKTESGEDLALFDDIEKEQEEQNKSEEASPSDAMLTRLDKSLNKLEKVIGGALSRDATTSHEMPYSQSNDTNSSERTASGGTDAGVIDGRDGAGGGGGSGWASAHASPCPSGELRCVDGRCITIAQLCDGIVDCTDNADEDNCFT